MASFDLAIGTVLKNEGGLENNPSDPGGITNYGISLRFLQTIHPESTAQDIRDMTESKATQIYETQFWERYKYNMIADQKLATKVFDLCVNMGAIPANQCLQRAVFATSHRAIDQDGVLGPNSLFAINNSAADCVLAALKSEAAGHYRCIIQANPKLKIFEKGWLTRCYSDV